MIGIKFFTIFLSFFILVHTEVQDQFEVLNVANVPFPSSSGVAASFNALHSEDIAEFTICYRFLIESYNDLYIILVRAKAKDTTPWDWRYH